MKFVIFALGVLLVYLAFTNKWQDFLAALIGQPILYSPGGGTPMPETPPAAGQTS